MHIGEDQASQCTMHNCQAENRQTNKPELEGDNNTNIDSLREG